VPKKKTGQKKGLQICDQKETRRGREREGERIGGEAVGIAPAKQLASRSPETSHGSIMRQSEKGVFATQKKARKQGRAKEFLRKGPGRGDRV